jgi:hypothetical protein
LSDRYCRFSGVKWTKAAADAQLKSVTRRIFFDPSLSFDPTTLEPCSSVSAKASASSLKKWSAQLSYFPTMTETQRRHKRFDKIFCRFNPGARANCQGGEI